VPTSGTIHQGSGRGAVTITGPIANCLRSRVAASSFIWSAVTAASSTIACQLSTWRLYSASAALPIRQPPSARQRARAAADSFCASAIASA